MKKLPIGVEDFAICSNLFYVDKTLLIKDIIDYFYGKSVLITRPRRFGKSLNISMIDYFFSINKCSKDLFIDKNISKEKEKYLNEMNKYPVIHLNMKNVKADNYESLSNNLIDIISLEYRKFDYLLNSDRLLDIEKKEYLNVIEKKSTNVYDYTLAIYKLCIMLYKYHQQKVIILIDEYDTVIEDAYSKNYYNQAISLIRDYYSSFLKGNEYLQFSILTGVLEIAKESIFSDLNNLEVYSVDKKDLTEYFGFTKQEVLYILDYFNQSFDMKLISKWYGGYGNDELEIYNPWSILNLVNNEGFASYWTNTGSNETICNLIKLVDDSYNSLNEIVNNRHQLVKFNNTISYKDLNSSMETIVSYLVQSGYLVVDAKKINDLYFVKIPNFEIENVFENEIIARNFNKPMLKLALDLKVAIENGDGEVIKTILNEYVLTSFSYYDLRNEKEYQSMLTGILAVLFNDYLVKTAVNNKKGRCDVMILPKSGQNKGFIIEIKYMKGTISSNKLNTSSLLAIKQIKKQDYKCELDKYNIKKSIFMV